MTLAAIIHTLNADEFLVQCLDAIGDHPVYIFDQGSVDNTINIARARNNITLLTNCRQFIHGEAEARNVALNVVGHVKFFTHFLRIDADEILTDGWYEQVAPYANATCITVDYWQMLGRPIMSQLNNPVETRGLIYDLSARPHYVPRPGKNWHCGMSQSTNTIHLYPPALIHLGYATKNLVAKWRANVDRGDYSDRDDVNVYLRQAVTANPLAHLPARGPIPSELLAQSKILRDLTNE